ncbi:MAG: asparagine--tRNA ligase [Clostridia bacterium]|nr:asparagine--tRNA ligase [Clostridia bacterium]
MDIKEIYLNKDKFMEKEVIINGWIRNHRKQKDFGFIDFHDGSCFKSIQVVYDNKLADFDEIQKFKIGSSISVTGKIIKSPASGQDFELQATSIILLGNSEDDYPIQPKRHTREFLREQAYLRPRTNLFQAVFRVRSLTAHAIHSYFQENGYVYVNSPIITGNDAEGAGEVFQVTTLDLNKLKNSKEIPFDEDFYGKPVGLAVTGQLEAETYAMAFKKVYTFGPTFRAENSNTKYHASEFWMIEPEIAFCDLNGLMDIEEDCLKYIIKYLLKHAKDEMEFFDKFVEKGLLEKLNNLLNSHFTRIDFKNAITLLKESAEKFENTPSYDEDIAKEHEKFLTNHFGGPVFLTNWPKDIKAFYMKQNEDEKTVAAVDLLVPGAGELMGGSQREESYEKLVDRMNELDMNINELDWYVNLRKYGGCTHSGFGIGFERLLMYITGIDNIRDVIPYPRTPKNCEF